MSATIQTILAFPNVGLLQYLGCLGSVSAQVYINGTQYTPKSVTCTATSDTVSCNATVDLGTSVITVNSYRLIITASCGNKTFTLFDYTCSNLNVQATSTTTITVSEKSAKA